MIASLVSEMGQKEKKKGSEMCEGNLQNIGILFFFDQILVYC